VSGGLGLLAALSRSLQAALAKAIGGKGQVVGVVADPGVGKSRLCMEFVELCRTRGITADRHALVDALGSPVIDR
jgi:predicted ATPase